MNYGKMLSFAFTNWVKDKEAWKPVIGLIALWFIYIGIMAILFPEIYLTLGSFSESAYSDVFSGVVTGVLTLVFTIISFYFYALLIIRALERSKMKVSSFDLEKFAKFIVLYIVTGIYALLCIKKLRFLIIGIIGSILAVAGAGLTAISVISGILSGMVIGGIILLIIGVILLLVYGVAVIYMCLRLIFPGVIFLQKGIGIIEAINESWRLTRNRVLDILVASIIIGIICMLIVFAFMGIGLALSFALGIMVLYLALVYLVSGFLEAVSEYYYVAMYKDVLESKGYLLKAEKTKKKKKAVKKKKR